MAGERYVALGLAPARAAWFTDMARWSTSGVLPVDFVKCITAEELRARLRSGRAWSAAVVDAAVAALDRDLVSEAIDRGCPVFVVDDGRTRRNWRDLGVAAELAPGFDRDDMLSALREHAALVPIADRAKPSAPETRVDGWRGHLVTVTGSGGTGASVLAMALAQAFASDPRHQGLVVLADLALDADQALLHDAGDVVPGVPELVDAHRAGRPSTAEVRALAYAVDRRGYDLLLGLRRHRDWAAIRPRAFAAALDGLRQAYKIVVADVTGDLEGERECGSADVEDRNAMARTTCARADVVVAVGLPGVKGVHRFVRLLDALVQHGVPRERIVPVVNRAPRAARAKAEVTAAIRELSSVGLTPGSLATPLFVPDRSRLDDALHGATPLPDALVSPLGRAVSAVLDRASGDSPAHTHDDIDGEPVLVSPGSVGHYADDDG